MGRFANTVPFYRRFRPPYPPALFRKVARELELDGSQALIDLGCGPGPLAIGFAPYVSKLVGVDPEPGMLEAAREAAEESDVRLRLIDHRTHTLPPQVGRFDVATIGRALHWMPRRATVARLTRLISPGGHIVICGASPAEDANPWLEKYQAFHTRAATKRDRDRYKIKPEDFFAGSPFKLQATITVRARHTIPVETLVGRLFSMSNSSPAVFGQRSEFIAGRLLLLLLPFADASERVREVVEARAVIFVHAKPGAGDAKAR